METKVEQGKGVRVSVLNKVVKVGLIEVAFEQTLEGSGGVNHVGIWGKSVPGTGNRQCKDSDVVMCLACSGNRKMVLWLVWSERRGGERLEMERPCRTLLFAGSEMESHWVVLSRGRT